MSPRTGRPKIEKPKNIDVKVRFDEESHEELLEYCKNQNVTKTQVIRKAVSEYLEKETKK